MVIKCGYSNNTSSSVVVLVFVALVITVVITTSWPRQSAWVNLFPSQISKPPQPPTKNGISKQSLLGYTRSFCYLRVSKTYLRLGQKHFRPRWTALDIVDLPGHACTRHAQSSYIADTWRVRHSRENEQRQRALCY